MRKLCQQILRLPAMLVITLVRGYQLTLSPLVGRQCRFHPTCSNYMILAIRKHGVVVGVAKGIWRICRCHPFHAGGIDYP